MEAKDKSIVRIILYLYIANLLCFINISFIMITILLQFYILSWLLIITFIIVSCYYIDKTNQQLKKLDKVKP